MLDHASAEALDNNERQRCEVWTRVMGYHRPVASFNVGKRQEFRDRLYFSEAAAQHSLKSFQSKRHKIT